MRMMEITDAHVSMSERRMTGLLYVVLGGNEYQKELNDEKLDLYLGFRATLIAVVNSGWLKFRGAPDLDLPSESYVRALPKLQVPHYRYNTIERYFLTPKGHPRVGVNRSEYLSVQCDVVGTDNFDPFIGPEPVEFDGERVVGRIQHWPEFAPPVIEHMSPFPAESNPFHYDHSNMGTQVSGGWFAMYDQFAGLDRNGNPHPEPKYIIMVNSRTGQRFKILF